MGRQTLAKNGLQQIPPHVLAEITQAVAVGVLILVCWVARVKGPQVAAVVDVTNPPPMFHLPAVGHPIAIGIRIGRVGRSISATSGPRTEPALKVNLLCQFASLLVAEILFVEIVAVEVSRLGEPAPILLAIGQPVSVGVHITGVGAVVPTLSV